MLVPEREREHAPELAAEGLAAGGAGVDRARRARRAGWMPARGRNGAHAPELAAEVLAAGDVVVDQARRDVRPEEALPAERLRRERVAREPLEVAAQPRCRGNREAALAAVDDSRRQQRLRGPAQ